MNPVVHFELPAEDNQRMSDFYSSAFGWKTEILGPEMGNYVVVTTTELEENGRPKEPGAINGGFFKKSENNKFPTIVISVEDIQAAMKKVEEAGGKITGGSKPGEPDDIPGVGLYIAFMDTEGNRIALLQPKGM
jgi:uncharacterized protein